MDPLAALVIVTAIVAIVAIIRINPHAIATVKGKLPDGGDFSLKIDGSKDSEEPKTPEAPPAA